MRIHTTSLLAALALVAGCDDGGTNPSGSGSIKVVDDNASNPLLEADQTGKADTAYYNPNGIEIEVDIEADIEAPAARKGDGPAILGQFALTYFRRNETIFLESLAEQASSPDRVEWLVDGQWKTARQLTGVASSKLTHFRIRGINAVLLDSAKTGVVVGSTFDAPVPKKPFSIMADAGKSCAEDDGHITLDQSIYWYMWDPDLSSCKVAKTNMKVTVSKMFSASVPYPEWDKLVADKKITMVVLFGLIDDELGENETGMRAFKQMATWLTQGGFTEVKPAPVGKRFTKTVGGTAVEVDIYSPYDFSGLDDEAHFGNFQKAVSEHEVVAYDGHSMLGASDFWGRPSYPSFYQVFLYGGCLGYEYYIAPILAGKGGNWSKLDMLSSVVEVTANANEYAGPFIAKTLTALGNGFKVSWKDILGQIRTRVGDSTFGMSGVRDNCFSPTGSLCGGASDPRPVGTPIVFSATPAVAIPDASTSGVSSKIEVKETLTVNKLKVALKLTHTYTGDLVVTLSQGAVTKTIFDGGGAAGVNLDKSFDVTGWGAKAGKGTWTLKVVDKAGEDVGTLDAWSLTITPK